MSTSRWSSTSHRRPTTDDVTETVHYGELADRVVAIVGGPPVALIETLADRLVTACLDDVRVAAATVTVHKPQAPIAAFVHRRRRHDPPHPLRHP